MFCLDTYALVGISKGDEKFSSLLDNEFCITNLTLAEFYGVILRSYDERTADYWYDKLVLFAKEVPNELLINAVKFRFAHRKEKLSFFDCVGYVFSLDNKLKFVTGDKFFKNQKGVLFLN